MTCAVASSDPALTPVIVAAARTPIGTSGGIFARVEAADLLAPVLARLAAQGSSLGTIDEVIIGNCMGPGGNIARVGALAAGLGEHVPAVSVDRQCGSGQEAIHQACALIASGGAQVVIAGGVESASTAPFRFKPPASAGGQLSRYTRAPFAPSEFGDPDMGPAADAVAAKMGISRERQEQYAIRSHERCLRARSEGAFNAELVSVAGHLVDERPRLLNPRAVARLRPAFSPAGTVTAATACGVSDGCGAVLVVSEKLRVKARLRGLKIRGWASSGCSPQLPGLGPVSAVRKLLETCKVDVSSVGVWEITEAFAAQVLACLDALGVDALGADADRVCPQGGALGLGHPWGASGALLAVRLFAQMLTPRGPNCAVATCAVGGGQGLALLAETGEI